ncbi:MAG TPA: amidohydrolase family protein [Flavitalea sp.]|nr:amidohydrolase family protein [Flavitalea sp.]
MPLRKFSADHLFTGYAMLGHESVLVTDEAGIVKDIILAADAGEGVEKFHGILSPGLINCHCHLELSHMAGMVKQNSGMTKFLLSVMKDRNADEEKITAAMQDAEMKMKECGIVAVGDVCNTPYSLNIKSNNILYYHNFIEATGFADAKAEERFKAAFDVYLKFRAAENVNNTSIVPHSPYSVSDILFSLINDFEKGSLMSIHNQESVAETEFFTTGKGELLDLYQALGINTDHFVPSKQSSLVRSVIKITGDHSLILVHNVNTTANDLDEIRRGRNLPQLYWCLCPNANLYINGYLPDVSLLKNFNCTLVIGTDSLASNTGLSILEELKTLQANFNSFGTAELLRWATINGAQALRVDSKFGSFEAGKQPGIVNITGGMNESLEGASANRIL